MIQKKHSHVLLSTANTVELTDDRKGSGQLKVEGIGPGRYVQDPRPPGNGLGGYYGYGYYGGGHTEYDQWRVVGTAMPDSYSMAFALKLYDDGTILPASISGATIFRTKAEAADFGEKWIALGGPGLALEDPADTRQRHLEARSSFAYGKAAYWLNQLTDVDLLRLSTEAGEYAAKRAEKAAKAAARAEEKRLKATEKLKLAEAKAAAKAAKVAAAEAKAAAKAAKAAEKARKQAEKDQKATAKALDVAIDALAAT